MEVLQLLSQHDLRNLQLRFAQGTQLEGLAEEEFVDVFREVLECKVAGRAYSVGSVELDAAGPSTPEAALSADVLLRWTREELSSLFQEVDYNGDKCVSFTEFTSFAIASAVHANRTAAQERPFKDYLPIDIPFSGQSPQLRAVLPLPHTDRCMVVGFTKTTVHNAESGDCLHVLPHSSGLLDAVFASAAGLYCLSSDQNQLLLLEDAPAASPPSTMLVIKHQLSCDRAMTHLGYVPFRCRIVAADREGVIRTLDASRLMSTRGAASIRAMTMRSWSGFPDGVAVMKHLPLSALNNPSVMMLVESGSTDVVLYDCEVGAPLLRLPSGLRAPLRDVTYSDTQRLVLACSTEKHLTAFSVEQPQQFPYELRDAASPHVHHVLNVHAVAGTHRAITTDHSGVIKVWDLRQLQCAATFSVPRASDNSVNTVAAFRFDDARNRIFALGKETAAFEYDKRTTAVYAHDDPLVAVAFAPRANSILSITGTQFRHWSLATGVAVATRKDLVVQTTRRAQAASVEVTCAALDELSGRQVVFGTADGFVGAMLASTGRELWRRRVTKGRIAFIFMIARGTLAVGTAAGMLYAATENGDVGLSLSPIGGLRSAGFGAAAFAARGGLIVAVSSVHRRLVYAIDTIKRSCIPLVDQSESLHNPEFTVVTAVFDGRESDGDALSLFALADSASHVHLWAVCRNNVATRLRILSLRIPRHGVAAALCAVGEGMLVAGTDSGIVVVWDVRPLVAQVVLEWRSHWGAKDVCMAAAAAPRALRKQFAAHGDAPVATLTALTTSSAFVMGTMNDDPMLLIYDVDGACLGALCRGRNTAAADDLGAFKAYTFATPAMPQPHVLGDELFGTARHDGDTNGAGDVLERDDDHDRARRRRKHHRHLQKHKHDLDLVKVAAFEATVPAAIQDLIASDPVVRQHHGIDTAFPSEPLEEQQPTTAVEAATRRPSHEPVVVSHNIMKPTRVPSILLAKIKAQAAAKGPGRGGLSGSIRVEHSEASPRSGRASMSFIQTCTSVTVDRLDPAEVEQGAVESGASSDSDMPEQRAFLPLGGATPGRSRRPTVVAGVAGSPLPSVAPVPSPPKRRACGRLRAIGELIIPPTVAFPPVPKMTTKEAGWQQVVNDHVLNHDRAPSHQQLGSEVSMRTADAALLLQFQAELDRAKAARTEWRQRSRSPFRVGTAQSLVATTTDAQRIREARRVRLDRSNEERSFVGPSGDVVSFTSRAWKRRVVDPRLTAVTPRK
jgi:hypothetical protein